MAYLHDEPDDVEVDWPRDVADVLIAVALIGAWLVFWAAVAWAIATVAT